MDENDDLKNNNVTNFKTLNTKIMDYDISSDEMEDSLNYFSKATLKNEKLKQKKYSSFSSLSNDTRNSYQSPCRSSISSNNSVKKRSYSSSPDNIRERKRKLNNRYDKFNNNGFVIKIF